MHPNEHPATIAQAAALIAAQMPDLSGLPLRQVGASGTDNVLYRIGPTLVARFPRLPQAQAQIALLSRWLPTLRPALPLAVPLATRFGRPGAGYPYAWTVGPWLAGQDAHAAPPDLPLAVQDMAQFLHRLHAQALPPGAPDQTQSHRLDLRLAKAEEFIAQITEFPDHVPLYHLLATSRALAPHQGPQVWTHSDLHPLNLLTNQGRISAVIDWGAMGPVILRRI